MPRLAGHRPKQAKPPGGDVTEPVAPDGPLAEPLKSADHAAWVEYAVSKGADRTDAQAADKQDLIVAFGSGKRR